MCLVEKNTEGTDYLIFVLWLPNKTNVKITFWKSASPLREGLASKRQKKIKNDDDSVEMKMEKDFSKTERLLCKLLQLLLAQSELEGCRKELDTKSSLLISVQAREKQLEGDFTQAKEKVDTLEKEW